MTGRFPAHSYRLPLPPSADRYLRAFFLHRDSENPPQVLYAPNGVDTIRINFDGIGRLLFDDLLKDDVVNFWRRYASFFLELFLIITRKLIDRHTANIQIWDSASYSVNANKDRARQVVQSFLRSMGFWDYEYHIFLINAGYAGLVRTEHSVDFIIIQRSLLVVSIGSYIYCLWK